MYKLKIAYTGSHGTGKTTSVYETAQKMKLQHPNKSVGILTENAKDSPFNINKNTCNKSQLWIFTNQISRELELETKYDILICDRTIMDSIAYTMHSASMDLSEKMYELAIKHMSSYSEVFFKTIQKNNFLIEDGVRDGTDRQYQQEIEDKLKALYDSYTSKYPLIIHYI